MRIVFICGSIQPGKDGVGDYTRLLASELINNGNEVGIIGLYDRHTKVECAGWKDLEKGKLTYLAIPSSFPQKERSRLATGFIKEFDPEILSLQFVIFSFHDKGLPYSLPDSLSEIGAGRPWHIMFHEIWVGPFANSPIKLKVWGKLQQLIIGRLIRKLNPLAYHTQSGFYQKKLIEMLEDIKLLPLFSNIRPLKELSERDNAQLLLDERKNLSAVVFGTIHPNAPVDAFVADLAEFTELRDIRFSISFIGHNGKELDKWKNTFICAGFDPLIVGQQTDTVISTFLSEADFAITTTRFPLIEKSGTVAAFLEHGLNVICIAEEAKPSVPEMAIEGVFLYKRGNFVEFLNSAKRFKHIPSLKIVTAKFHEDLVSLGLTAI